MTLGNRAAFAVQPLRWGLAAAGLLALAHLSGCSHHRQTTYRPVYTSPASATAPCTNCGSSSRASSSVVTESEELPSSSVPSLSAPSTDSAVTPSTSIQKGSGSGSGSAAVRSSPIETPPSARIGQEPEYDEYAPTYRRKSARPSTPSAVPSLDPPKGNDNTSANWNTNDPNARLAGRWGKANSGGGTAARLEPFIAGSASRELYYPNKADRPWRYIVLHHSASSAGSYDEIDREHRKTLGFDGCGYHFVIGNGNGSGDGVIEVARRWDTQKAGFHCRNARSHDVDEYGIGVCLVGDLDQNPPTPRQVAATRALIAYLSQRYRIDDARITTHAHLATTEESCPGRLFPNSILATSRTQSTQAW